MQSYTGGYASAVSDRWRPTVTPARTGALAVVRRPSPRGDRCYRTADAYSPPSRRSPRPFTANESSPCSDLHASAVNGRGDCRRRFRRSYQSVGRRLLADAAPARARVSRSFAWPADANSPAPFIAGRCWLDERALRLPMANGERRRRVCR